MKLLNLSTLELWHIITTGVVQFTLKVMVNHGTHRCISPNVFSGLNHVDNRIDWQDDTEQADWCADGAHQGQGQEIAAHWNARITNSSENGNK